MAITYPGAKPRVIIIGAGTVGLLIAQGLKKRGIKATVIERENYLNERSRDWNFGIYWAQSHLGECLPRTILDKIGSAQVNPHEIPSEDDNLPIFNGSTGETLGMMPSPYCYRLARSRFRALIAEGIDIKYGKRLKDITLLNTSNTVNAHFEDGTSATGTLLVGADGANSLVRKFLLGPEKAALQDLSLMGCGTVTTLPGELALKIKTEYNNLYVSAVSPAGLVAFIALHDLPSPTADPSTWQWMMNLTWRAPLDDASMTVPTSPHRIHLAWHQQASHLTAEPFRTIFASVKPTTQIWCDRLSHWPTVPWDNCGGRVTLAGDAAHPMTYHRGQGLNNAVQDAANLCNAVASPLKGRASSLKGRHPNSDTIVKDASNIAGALAEYEIEMVKRGHEAVVSSAKNSLMLHDWDRLMESAIFKLGARKDGDVEEKE